MLSSTAQQPRIFNINTGSEENNIQGAGLPPAEIMARLKNQTPAGDTLITKLKDPPLFLFSSIPGRDKTINVFCDSGNSHYLFTEGIPENLYGTRTKNGSSWR